MQDERERLRAAGFTDAEIDAELGPKRPTVRVAAESSSMQGPGKAPARASQDLEYVKGLARQGAQGATLGFADEGEAGLRALASGGKYKELRDAIRAKNDAFAAENPKAALAANIAGGVLTGGAVAGAAKGAGALGTAARLVAPRVDATASLAARVGQAARVGGLTGAVGGWGAAQEMGDVPTSAAIGAGVGAAGGALFAGVGDAVRGARNLAARVGQGQKAAGAIRQAIRADDPEQTAAKSVLRRLGAQNSSLDELAARSARADGPDVLGEVIGEKGIRDIRKTRGLGFEAPDVIEETLRTRSRNDVGALRGVVRSELGDQVDDATIRPMKLKEAQTAAGPIYRDALDGVTITDGRVPEFLKRPVMARAWKAAGELARNDGESMPSFTSVIRNAAGRADDMADETVGGVATKAARTDGGSLRSFDKVSTADLVNELESLTTRQQRDIGQSVYNFVETEQRGGNYGTVVPTATKSGSGPSMQAKAQRRVEQTDGVIDRIIGELDNRGIDWTDAMARRAAGEADDFADDVARTVPGRGAVSLPDEGAAAELPTVTGRQLQYVKLALRDELMALEGKAGGTATTRYAQAQKALDDVDNLLYEFANQGEDGANLWGKANQTYAKPMQEADAFAEGVRGGRSIQAPDVPRLLGDGLANWRAKGVANTLQDDLGRMKDGTTGVVQDPAPMLMGSDVARARLEVAAAGDLGKVGRIEDAAQNVSRRLRTKNIVSGGSQTFEKFMDGAEEGIAPGDLLQAARSPTNAVIGAMGKGANALRRNVQGQDMDALARLLLAGGPKQMTREQAIKRLRELEPAITAMMTRQALIRGGAGGMAGRAASDGR